MISGGDLIELRPAHRNTKFQI